METKQPEIPHITQNYVRLQSLFLAVSERCGKELANILRTSESQFSQLARKEQFLKFVVAARQQYVKLYVLCKWAVVYKNISKAIDVTNWLHGQINCFNNVVAALYHLQLDLAPAKSPWADLETALEVFKYGAPTPTLEAAGFMPRKQLPDKDVLGVLRRLDVLIAMRLALHEHLPAHYSLYTVENGRARFELGAMWLELSIADEDVASQCRFFFVDCGLVNTERKQPTLSSKFKAGVEQAVNALLAKPKLLPALNFVSQLEAIYRLQLLDQQLRLAEDPSEVWSGVVKHRAFPNYVVISCFVNTKAPVDVTIRVSAEPPFHLEIVPAAIKLGLQPGSRESVFELLSSITHHYAAKKLENVSAPWIARVGDFSVQFQCSPQRTIELNIDPVSGLFALSGNGPLFEQVQHRLNTQPGISVVDALVRLRAQVSLDTIAARAEAAGWRAQRNVKLAPDELAKIKPALYLLTLRIPNDFSGWSLCATFGSSEPKWFVSRVLCEQRRWVLGPIHEVDVYCEAVADLQDAEYGCFAELLRGYRQQFVLFELMRELMQQNFAHELRVRNGERVVIANFRQILPSAEWAQSGLLFRVRDGLLLAEGRSRAGQLQALGEISQSGADFEIKVDGAKNTFVVSTPERAGSELYLQHLTEALGKLNYAACSLTSATSLGLEVRSATLSSLEIKYVTPNGILEVQNNAKIIFGETNPQRPLAPFLSSIDSSSKFSLVKTVTFLREWYPVWDIVTKRQGDSLKLLPQCVNRLRVLFGNSSSSPYLEISLRSFRRHYSVNFVTAGNGAEQNEIVRSYFTQRQCDGVVPLVSGCAIDLGSENVLVELIEALS